MPRPGRDLVAILGSGGVILGASNAWEQLLGRPVSELHGRRLDDLVAEGRWPAGPDLTEAGALPWRLVLRAEGGRLVRIEVTLVEPIDQPDGPAVVVVAREELEPAKDPDKRLALTDRLASMGTLAAGFVHDLNNMFTPILVNLQRLQRELHTLSVSADLDVGLLKVRQGLAGVQKAVEHVAELGRDLKRFSSEEPEIFTPVDLRRVLTTALGFTMHELRARARVVEEYFDPPQVRGGEVALCQVFVNLLLNAAQAIPEGSRTPEHEIWVSVRTSPHGAGRAHLNPA